MVEEVATARRFTPTQTVVQIYGTCEDCRAGAGRAKTRTIDGATTELVFARDALRIAIATERSGFQFYTRAANLTKDARGRTVFQKLAAEEREHLTTLEQRYRELIATDPELESRPTFLFFKGAANGLFDEGAAKLRKGVNDQQALLIGIKCERGSHNFFKRYGERFEDSQGKQIFLEFAEEEREHLDLLIREYRALTERQRQRTRRTGGVGRQVGPLIDLHTHTTASDGRCTPPELVARAAAAGVTVLSVTDHDTVAGCAAGGRRLSRRRHRVRRRHRSDGRARRRRRAHAGLLHRRRVADVRGVSDRAAARADRPAARDRQAARDARHRARRRRDPEAGDRRSVDIGGTPVDRARPGRGGPCPDHERRLQSLVDARPAGLRSAGRRAARRGDRSHSFGVRDCVGGASRSAACADEWLPRGWREPASTRSKRITPITTRRRPGGTSSSPPGWASPSLAARTITPTSLTAARSIGSVSLPREAYEQPQRTSELEVSTKDTK